MNIDDDFGAFCAKMDDLWAMKGQTLTAGARVAFFRALEAYPLNEVVAGIDAHVRDSERGRFLPMPADVIAQIKSIVADDGRPGVEEAWGTCLSGADEGASLIWTDEMSVAFGVAQPALRAGDVVAARMAFREKYSNLVVEARERRMPPSWSLSLGHDKTRRDTVLKQAVALGRVPADLLLEAPSAGLDDLLRLSAPSGMSDQRRAQIKQLSDRLAKRPKQPSASELQAQADRERTQALKTAAAQKVAAFDGHITNDDQPVQP